MGVGFRDTKNRFFSAGRIQIKKFTGMILKKNYAGTFFSKNYDAALSFALQSSIKPFVIAILTHFLAVVLI